MALLTETNQGFEPGTFNKPMGSSYQLKITSSVLSVGLTCEEPEGRLSLGAQDFDPAEEGESDSKLGLGEGLDVPAGPRLRVSKLSTGEGQHVEVRGPQHPVHVLQGPVVLLSVLAVTRHVYNQRRLSREGGKTMLHH